MNKLSFSLLRCVSIFSPLCENLISPPHLIAAYHRPASDAQLLRTSISSAFLFSLELENFANKNHSAPTHTLIPYRRNMTFRQETKILYIT